MASRPIHGFCTHGFNQLQVENNEEKQTFRKIPKGKLGSAVLQVLC
jgi:hypothetical protein